MRHGPACCIPAGSGAAASAVRAAAAHHHVVPAAVTPSHGAAACCGLLLLLPRPRLRLRRGWCAPRLRGVDRMCQYRTHRVVVAAVAMGGGLVVWRWVRVATAYIDCVVARTAAWAAGRAHAAVTAAAACITTPPPLDVSLRRLACKKR